MTPTPTICVDASHCRICVIVEGKGSRCPSNLIQERSDIEVNRFTQRRRKNLYGRAMAAHMSPEQSLSELDSKCASSPGEFVVDDARPCGGSLCIIDMKSGSGQSLNVSRSSSCMEILKNFVWLKSNSSCLLVHQNDQLAPWGHQARGICQTCPTHTKRTAGSTHLSQDRLTLHSWGFVEW